MPEPLQEWIEAFTAAQAEFPAIGKGSVVDTGTFSYKYATLPDILALVRPVLHARHLSFSQSVSGERGEIAVETRIYHSGGHVEVFGPLVLNGGDAKAAGSAITYARRYALTAALGIAPDEDDDGAQASQRREEIKERTPWQWVWAESAVFKAWTVDERTEAARVAMQALAFTEEPKDMDEAKAILEHMRGQYESRSETLPTEAAE